MEGAEKKEDVKEEAQKEQAPAAPIVKEAREEEAADYSKNSSKILIISIIIIVALFAIFLSLKFIYKPHVYTVEEMYERTLQGKESDTNYLYNGFVFIKTEGLWFGRVKIYNELYNVALHYGPRDIENITVTGDPRVFLYIIMNHNNMSTYVTFDPDEENLAYVALANAELSINMAKTIGVTPVAACTNNASKGCEGVPEIKCDNSTTPVIYLKQANETMVSLKGLCLTIQGRGQELVRAADKVLLMWYGVMD